jgi:hypothetical protein
MVALFFVQGAEQLVSRFNQSFLRFVAYFAAGSTENLDSRFMLIGIRQRVKGVKKLSYGGRHDVSL